MCRFVYWTDDCFWKAWGVHLLFKQEVDGSIIVGDSHEYASVKNRDAIGFDLRDDINRYFIDEGKKILDLPHWDVESSWAGLYCQTKHESGIFQKTIDGRIHIVTGIGGKGMTSSPGFSKHHIAQRCIGKLAVGPMRTLQVLNHMGVTKPYF